MIATEATKYSLNSSIDTEIKEMLAYFDAGSRRRIHKFIKDTLKTLRKHSDEKTDENARHIFRELIPASRLNKKGFAFEYSKKIQGKTPDWIDNNARIILESYTYERGGNSNFFDRVTPIISYKCNKYKNILEENSLRFIIAIYLDFLSDTFLFEVREDYELYSSLFKNNNLLSAILFFSESNFVGDKQEYDFYCICVDSSIKTIKNWPFETKNLIQ